MAIQLAPEESSIWRIVQAIIQLVQGRSNNVGDVTLRTGQTTTTVSFPNCSKDCRVFLDPQTANAAAIKTTTFVLRANILQGSFVITHPSSANTDLTFSFQCAGG